MDKEPSDGIQPVTQLDSAVDQENARGEGIAHQSQNTREHLPKQTVADSSDSDSGDSLFLTQREVQPVRTLRRTRPLQDPLCPDPVETSSSEEDSSGSLDITKWRGYMERQRRQNRKGHAFPFLEKFYKTKYLTRRNWLTVEHAAFGGFFKCIKKASKAEVLSHIMPFSVFSQQRCLDSTRELSPLSDPEEKEDIEGGEESCDVKVVKQFCFIKEIAKTKKAHSVWSERNICHAAKADPKTRKDKKSYRTTQNSHSKKAQTTVSVKRGCKLPTVPRNADRGDVILYSSSISSGSEDEGSSHRNKSSANEEVSQTIQFSPSDTGSISPEEEDSTLETDVLNQSRGGELEEPVVEQRMTWSMMKKAKQNSSSLVVLETPAPLEAEMVMDTDETPHQDAEPNSQVELPEEKRYDEGTIDPQDRTDEELETAAGVVQVESDDKEEDQPEHATTQNVTEDERLGQRCETKQRKRKKVGLTELSEVTPVNNAPSVLMSEELGTGSDEGSQIVQDLESNANSNVRHGAETSSKSISDSELQTQNKEDSSRTDVGQNSHINFSVPEPEETPSSEPDVLNQLRCGELEELTMKNRTVPNSTETERRNSSSLIVLETPAPLEAEIMMDTDKTPHQDTEPNSQVELLKKKKKHKRKKQCAATDIENDDIEESPPACVVRVDISDIESGAAEDLALQNIQESPLSDPGDLWQSQAKKRRKRKEEKISEEGGEERKKKKKQKRGVTEERAGRQSKETMLVEEEEGTFSDEGTVDLQDRMHEERETEAGVVQAQTDDKEEDQPEHATTQNTTEYQTLGQQREKKRKKGKKLSSADALSEMEVENTSKVTHGGLTGLSEFTPLNEPSSVLMSEELEKDTGKDEGSLTVQDIVSNVKGTVGHGAETPSQSPHQDAELSGQVELPREKKKHKRKKQCAGTEIERHETEEPPPADLFQVYISDIEYRAEDLDKEEDQAEHATTQNVTVDQPLGLRREKKPRKRKKEGWPETVPEVEGKNTSAAANGGLTEMSEFTPVYRASSQSLHQDEELKNQLETQKKKKKHKRKKLHAATEVTNDGTEEPSPVDLSQTDMSEIEGGAAEDLALQKLPESQVLDPGDLWYPQTKKEKKQKRKADRISDTHDEERRKKKKKKDMMEWRDVTQSKEVMIVEEEQGTRSNKGIRDLEGIVQEERGPAAGIVLAETDDTDSDQIKHNAAQNPAEDQLMAVRTEKKKKKKKEKRATLTVRR